MRGHFRIVLVGALLGAASASPAQTFDFEDLMLGTTTPFSLSNGGVTATFTSLDRPHLFSITLSFLNTMTGHILFDANDRPNPLGITFDQPLSMISLNFATNGAGPFTIEAFFGGTPIGTAALEGTTHPGPGFPEGIATFTGGPFNNVRLSSTAFDFAIDNITVRAVDAVPEPAEIVLVATGLLGLVPLMRRARRRHIAGSAG